MNEMSPAKNMLTIISSASLAKLVGYCLLAWVGYGVTLVVYRLFFSSLSRFPGPRLAAATFWYEFYYDVILGGQYTFHIAQLHARYGPVVRINPHELHVHQLDFYDQLYCAGGRRRHKWYWASRAFGADMSTFATEKHELHRVRRAALNPFFSAARVRQLEPAIRERVGALMKRIEGFRDKGKVLSLDVAFGAYSADIVVSYAFGRAGNKIEAPDFDHEFHDACVNGGKQLFLTRHFPYMLQLIKMMPHKWMLKLNPSMTSFFEMHKSIAIQAKALFREIPESRPKGGQTTIFHSILDSKLPPEEKDFERLATDGGALMGAGTVTTAWALTVAVFHLLRNPECLRKLKQELTDSGIASTINLNDEKHRLLTKVENLPYLSAVIQEALRLSYGVASRLARIAPDEALVVHDNGVRGRFDIPTVRDKEASAPTVPPRNWTIPPGTPISMTQLLIFRDERVFPSRSTFRPERWIEDPRLERYQVAFGGGSRICVGQHLALAEIYLMLTALFGAYGSREVKMANDIGYIELWETDETDIECYVDAFVPLAKPGTKGVRCRLRRWEEARVDSKY